MPLFKTKCLIGSPIYWDSCSCSSCVVTFYWIRTGLCGGDRERVRKEKKRKHATERREKKSLSTCSKTQCIVLKTEKGGIFLKWAKSRLQGVLRQRDERSSRERRKWGLRRRHLENCLLLTGSQPGTTPEKLAKHRRVCFREGRGVVEVGCSCRQLFRTTSSTCTEQRRLSEAPEDRCQWNPNKRHKRL